MKRILLLGFMIILLVCGCGKYDKNDVIKDLDKKLSKLNSYKANGELEIVNNDEVYNYDVDVSYRKDDYYKVSLVNQSNKYEQIILKNEDGVYVLTPALNKSFKFQSDWPNSNSQVYLIGSLIRDIDDDDNLVFKENKGNYILTTDVNYPSNSKLVKQEIIIDKKLNFKEVKVLDENSTPKMTMKFKNIEHNPTFGKNYFSLNKIMEDVDITGDALNTKETSFEESIYPLIIPSGTKLTSEEKIEKDDGERVILTYDGEKPFLLVEETVSVEDELTVVPTYGEPYMLMDVFGAMTNNSLTWVSGGIEYYLVSDVLSQNEIVEIAQSISVLPTMK